MKMKTVQNMKYSLHFTFSFCLKELVHKVIFKLLSVGAKWLTSNLSDQQLLMYTTDFSMYISGSLGATQYPWVTYYKEPLLVLSTCLILHL